MITAIRMTRHFEQTKIGYATFGDGNWRHVDCNDAGRHAPVGPTYKTKDELLADHEAYLVRAGWMKASDAPEVIGWHLCSEAGKVLMILVNQEQVDACKLEPGEYIKPVLRQRPALTELEREMMASLEALLGTPYFDGTQETSSARLAIRKQARAVLAKAKAGAA